MLITILMIAALILFGIPFMRALINGQVDFTNGGLAFYMLALLLGRGVG